MRDFMSFFRICEGFSDFTDFTDLVAGILLPVVE